MRVLVYPHTMEIGGSQLNAVQLAGAVRDMGHDVVVLSEQGPMVDLVRKLNLEHIEIPSIRGFPSAHVCRKLTRFVRERNIDVVHGYEWSTVIESFFGPALRHRTPLVGTVMSMSVVWFFPRTVPLIVGTEEIRANAVAAGHRRVTLLEPPVDTDHDDPAIVDGRTFRQEQGIAYDELLVVIVSRLASILKLEGLLLACDAISGLAQVGHRIRLVIVGGGPERDRVAAQAEKVNSAAGRDVVSLAGEMGDPRPAYAAADVVIGMGGSALRGLAFAKPLVVIGEDGFSELLTPDTLPTFLRQGWYGRGPGSQGAGTRALYLALERLIQSPDLRRQLSASSRQLILERFSLQRAARLQEAEYFAALEQPSPPFVRLKDTICTAGGLSARLLRRKYLSIVGETRPSFSGQ